MSNLAFVVGVLFHVVSFVVIEIVENHVHVRIEFTQNIVKIVHHTSYIIAAAIDVSQLILLEFQLQYSSSMTNHINYVFQLTI